MTATAARASVGNSCPTSMVLTVLLIVLRASVPASGVAIFTCTLSSCGVRCAGQQQADEVRLERCLEGMELAAMDHLHMPVSAGMHDMTRHVAHRKEGQETS